MGRPGARLFSRRPRCAESERHVRPAFTEPGRPDQLQRGAGRNPSRDLGSGKSTAARPMHRVRRDVVDHLFFGDPAQAGSEHSCLRSAGLDTIAESASSRALFPSVSRLPRARRPRAAFVSENDHGRVLGELRPVATCPPPPAQALFFKTARSFSRIAPSWSSSVSVSAARCWSVPHSSRTSPGLC